eukprot:tig00020734_g13579.t1
MEGPIFTPVQSLLGALLFGCGVFLLLLLCGRVAGVSGSWVTVIFGCPDGLWVRVGLIAGIIGGAHIGAFTFPRGFTSLLPFPTWQYALAGLLVGWGTHTANGCTSGHMICGASRLSLRSIAASATFCGMALVMSNALKRNFQGVHAIAPYAAATTEEIVVMCCTLAAVLFAAAAVYLLSPRGLRLLGEGAASLAGATISGLAVGAGLVYSGMGRQDAVLGFLNVMDVWNPSLMFVAGGALLPNLVLYFTVIRGMATPLLGGKFCLPSAKAQRSIDLKLIVGSAAFGAGWGLAGFCPGPALLNAARLEPTALSFVAFMTLGMAVSRLVEVKAATVVGTPDTVPAGVCPPCIEEGRCDAAGMCGPAEKAEKAIVASDLEAGQPQAPAPAAGELPAPPLTYSV